MVSPTHIDVRVLTNGQVVTLERVNCPISYKELVRRLEDMVLPTETLDLFTGHSLPTSFSSLWPYKVQVSTQKSNFSFKGSRIHLDEPLVQFYNESFLPSIDPETKQKTPEVTKSMIDHDKVQVGEATIGFRRTIRVPDNNKKHALPPDMGSFSIYNTGDLADRLQLPVVAKGGICIVMYQREAMWISFSQNQSCAVKVSVGGINALTGTPQGMSEPGRQDYLPLNGGPYTQLWLDGISTTPGVVRQFVAVPLGQGLTVEAQLTGQEAQGGMQFDVFPLYSTTVWFKHGTKLLNLYKTPRQLGLSVGTAICMANRRSLIYLWKDGGGLYMPDVGQTSLFLLACHKNHSEDLAFIKTLTGKTISIPLAIVTTLTELKLFIEDKEGIPPDQQRIIFAGREFDDSRPLSGFGIVKGCTLHLVLSLRGGGGDLGGIGVGGRISQKINKDPLPPIAYNYRKAARLHVTIINASYFTTLTGLSPPRSPVSATTYLKSGLPWFELYDEHIPIANNTSKPGRLSKVKSIGTLLRSSSTTAHAKGADTDMSRDCVYCVVEFATLKFVPCGHYSCDSCSSSVTKCPSCELVILGRKRIAAAMTVPGAEDDIGVEAGSLDDRLVKLKSISGTAQVITFMMKKDGVSSLTGEEKDSK